MRLFVLGATGRTGEEIIDLALARGHDLTAFVRSPHKLAARHRLQVVQGNPLDTDALGAALPGHDAVLSALGPRPREAFREHTLLTDCAASTVAAMTRAKVRRLGIVSAALMFPEKTLQFWFFQKLLRHHLRDLGTMEAVVSASELGWTIVRPPRLVAGADGAYHAANAAMPPGKRVVSFRCVAAFLLDAVERREHVAETVGLSQ